MGKERRRHQRFLVQIDVDCSTKLRTVQISSRDLSLGGVFLHTVTPEPPGTAISLVMHLPEGFAVSVEAKVAHCLKGVGMGIEFERFVGSGERRLQEFLKTLGDASGLHHREPTPEVVPIAVQLPSDRRAHERVPLKSEVRLEAGTNFYTGFSLDVSEGGLFIAAEELLPIGTQVDLEFSLPDGGPPIAVQAEVRWLRMHDASSEAPPGMGLKFVKLRPEDKRRIDDFIPRHDTLFYDE